MLRPWRRLGIPKGNNRSQGRFHFMTNRLALGLATVFIGTLIADHIWNDGAGSLFAARKFAELIEWTAFWR